MLRLCMFPLSLLNYIYLIFKIFQSTAVHPIDKRIMVILTNTRYCLHQSLVGLELSFKETLYSNFKNVFLYWLSSIQCRHTLMKGNLYTNCVISCPRDQGLSQKKDVLFSIISSIFVECPFSWISLMDSCTKMCIGVQNLHILTTYFIDRFHRP